MNSAELLSFAGAAGALSWTLLHAARGRTVADWALALGALLLATDAALYGLSLFAPDPASAIRLDSWRLPVLAAIPGAWAWFSVTYARSRVRGRRHLRRLVIVLALLVSPLAILLQWLVPIAGGALDPGVEPSGSGWPATVVFLWLLVGAVFVLMSLERTFRASVGTMRWQIKYTILGVGLVFVVHLYTSSQTLLFGREELPLESINHLALVLATPLLGVGYVRTSRREPDVYASQSLLQSSATILLAGIYLMVVGVLAKLIPYLGGEASFALKAFIVLLLIILVAILLQSDHARLHVRRLVSRTFQRSLFDYRFVWRRFTEATTAGGDQGELARTLVRLIAETFKALSVSIWLVNERQEGLQLAATTFPTSAPEPGPALDAAQTVEILHHFAAHPEVLDLERARQGWTATLLRLHPLQFENGGRRYAVPLRCGGEVAGVILLGDRIGGVPLAVQESDMLQCVADHAAASLRSLQLSQRLLAVRELEAFQTMATFFVHDLKNAASTLNLMLKNLPVHFDDPEFRQDALRGIGKTVTHINRLISRLGSIRNELKLCVAPCDLNERVRAAVDALDPASRQLVHLDLKPLPSAALDAEQVLKVLTNLVLNAREAVGAHGRIVVTTEHRGPDLVLSVSDNGCGMTPEFMARSLFRPFQTTKNGGLGIGMFQSKMIIEAHGGQVTVASSPGEGTRFNVRLPVQAATAKQDEMPAPLAAQ